MNASTRIHTTTRIGALALIGAATVLPALPAFANDADVIRTGSCSGASDWKVKASPENGRIEVEGEIDSNVVGQTWNWALRHNGTLSARGTKTTQAPSGSFEVRRVQNNLAGPDTFVFRAVNPASGEVCRGSVTF
jgi:hypothetical protein